MEGVPKTVGELNARLEELGNPWYVIFPSAMMTRCLDLLGGMLEEQKDTFANIEQMREELQAHLQPIHSFSRNG